MSGQWVKQWQVSYLAKVNEDGEGAETSDDVRLASAAPAVVRCDQWLRRGRRGGRELRLLRHRRGAPPSHGGNCPSGHRELGVRATYRAYRGRWTRTACRNQ